MAVKASRAQVDLLTPKAVAKNAQLMQEAIAESKGGTPSCLSKDDESLWEARVLETLHPTPKFRARFASSRLDNWKAYFCAFGPMVKAKAVLN